MSLVGGFAWARPLPTDINCYPPHLLRLQDGCTLCSYGYCWEHKGIRAVWSEDDGKSWNTESLITLQFADGILSTTCFMTIEYGNTHIAVTRWRPEEV